MPCSSAASMGRPSSTVYPGAAHPASTPANRINNHASKGRIERDIAGTGRYGNYITSRGYPMPNTTVKAAGTSWPTPSLPQFQRQFNPHRANRCHAAVLWTIRPICRIPDVHSSKGYAGGFGTDPQRCRRHCDRIYSRQSPLRSISTRLNAAPPPPPAISPFLLTANIRPPAARTASACSPSCRRLSASRSRCAASQRLNATKVINGVRFQLSALLDLKKKAIQGAFFVHD